MKTADIKRAANEFIAFRRMEISIAAICILMPLILIWLDGWHVRTSISDYVNIQHAHIYGLLLTMAGMLFLVNGVVYLRTDGLKKTKQHGRWYNIILGSLLLLIVLFDLDNFIVLHNVFALLFFVGSAFVIAFFNDRQHRKISIFIAFLTALGFVVLLIRNVFDIDALDWFTLFWAEWVSLTVIAVHYILESLEKLS
jgi:hypothetical protein